MSDRGHNKHEPKIHPAVWREELGPHLTRCCRAEAYLHAKFHLDPSNRLATVYTNVTDRQDRQRSDSIGRTVLQMVAQKAVFIKASTNRNDNIQWSSLSRRTAQTESIYGVYIAQYVRTSYKALRYGSHSLTCELQHACLLFCKCSPDGAMLQPQHTALPCFICVLGITRAYVVNTAISHALNDKNVTRPREVLKHTMEIKPLRPNSITLSSSLWFAS